MRRLLWILICVTSTNACSPSEAEKVTTPRQLLDSMRTHAANGKWELYWASFSEIGRGWFVGEAASAIALDGNVRPTNPEKGEEARRFLEKYELGTKRLYREANESVNDFRGRISKRLGIRGPEFCRELFLERKFPIFPESGEPRVLKEELNRATLQLPSGLQCNFSRIGDQWYVDGTSE